MMRLVLAPLGVVVVPQRIAILEGIFLFGALRSQAAGFAGLVINCRFGAGGFGFQIVFLCHFCCEVMGSQITICAAADIADCSLGAGRRTAGASTVLGVTAVFGADTGVSAIAVGRPGAPIVTQCGEGHIFGCVLCPVSFKGSLISAQAIRQAGRFGDHCIGRRDSLGFRVGLVLLADALCSAVVAILGRRPGVFRRAPVMAGGGKGDVFGLRGEAIHGKRCGVSAKTVCQTSRWGHHSVSRRVGDCAN